jgi:hypothetical protein
MELLKTIDGGSQVVYSFEECGNFAVGCFIVAPRRPIPSQITSGRLGRPQSIRVPPFGLIHPDVIRCGQDIRTMIMDNFITISSFVTGGQYCGIMQVSLLVLE